MQSFHGVGQAARRDTSGVEGAARARQHAWLQGFEFETSAKRCACRGAGRRARAGRDAPEQPRSSAAAACRHVPASSSALPTCRSTSPTRSCAARPALQADAPTPRAPSWRCIHAHALWTQLGPAPGAAGRASRKGEGRSRCPAALDDRRLRRTAVSCYRPAHADTACARARCSGRSASRRPTCSTPDHLRFGSSDCSARAVAGGLGARQDRRARCWPADRLRRLPDAVGAQGHRLDPDPSVARTASARWGLLQPDRRCGQARSSGDHRPDRGEQAACSSSRR